MTEITKLEKWRGALNQCIRCGYCYEHCPIYKNTRWEIDSPRGKLILMYGMISGEHKIKALLTDQQLKIYEEMKSEHRMKRFRHQRRPH